MIPSVEIIKSASIYRAFKGGIVAPLIAKRKLPDPAAPTDDTAKSTENIVDDEEKQRLEKERIEKEKEK